MIFAKENVSNNSFNVDKDDNSVMRSDEQYKQIFEEAGFQIVKHMY